MNEALVREIELLREFGYTHFDIGVGVAQALLPVLHRQECLCHTQMRLRP